MTSPPDRSTEQCRRGWHDDPDNSGMCIHCGLILDPGEEPNHYRRSRGWPDLPTEPLQQWTEHLMPQDDFHQEPLFDADVDKALRPRHSLRRTYRLVVSASIEVDDETLAEVHRLVQERVYEMYARLQREDDIRVMLQHQCAVVETP